MKAPEDNPLTVTEPFSIFKGFKVIVDAAAATPPAEEESSLMAKVEDKVKARVAARDNIFKARRVGLCLKSPKK
jgi:hypothetical protein